MKTRKWTEWINYDAYIKKIEYWTGQLNCSSEYSKKQILRRIKIYKGKEKRRKRIIELWKEINERNKTGGDWN